MGKQSIEIIEKEFLLSASPSEVLTYLQEKSKSVPDGKRWLYDECQFPESTAKALLNRNNRVIDIGLALVIGDSELIETLLTRHTKDSVIDSSVLTAILSNKLAVSGLYSAKPWLSKRIEWIAKNSSDEHIETLFSNTYIPFEVIDQALEKKDWCKDVNEDRYFNILFELLRNPTVLAEPEDDRDYDISQHGVISGYWNLLLTLPVSDLTASLLTNTLPKFQELSIPYSFSQTLGLSEDRKLWKENSIQSHKAFLNIVFSRWVRNAQDEDKGQSQTFDIYHQIKKYTVQKISSLYFVDLEEFLLSKNDFHITQGYFSGAFSSYNLSKLTINKFDSYLQKYGRPFLLGLTDNEGLFLKRNRSIGKHFSDAIHNFKEPDGIDDWDRVTSFYDYKLNELSNRKDAELYISSIFDFDEDSPLDSKETSIFELNTRLDEIKEKIANSNSSDSSSVNQQIKNLSEQIAVLSKKIDVVSTNSEGVTSQISQQFSAMKNGLVKSGDFPWIYVLIALAIGYIIGK
ncbi:hypothetical protein ICN28_06165 [Polynucleobacter sp. 30F-ANTBAC]|uniref:hypothetical protein n=1 Tax=Polynucleobacter sp. 30F-ANTBAC TaxID=2689095 RepID=UPI001C0C794C|nr:hypothetical protein [Polynucleobacter sp. 30F-ANTBAC]MBU3600097.1 hypothetical protein [Polynucleobacter sp. 30F-ANTBAC]